MDQLNADRRSLRGGSLRIVALAVCCGAMFASAAPASARSHHSRIGRHLHSHHGGDDLAHHPRRFGWHRRGRQTARVSHWERGVVLSQSRGLGNVQASLAPDAGASGMASGGYGASNVVAEARRYIGGNPTGRGSLWCARFMNLVLQRAGYDGTGSDMARSFASYGHRVSGPQIGAIAVMGRRGGGGHVGVVSGIDAGGNPIIVSGNNGNRVREAPVSRGRIYAYVMPAG